MIAVPAYFHPEREAADWARLAAVPGVRLIVVNPASGVGAAADPAYRAACAAVAPDVVVAGYVDTAYGERPRPEVLAEAAAYRRCYAVTAVFADQVPAGAADLPGYTRLVAELRRAGADVVVLNPGVAPDPGYRAIADVVVTFEGTWSAYRDRAADAPGPGRTCHLVYDTPAVDRAAAWRRARLLGAGYAYVTDRGLPNPWGGLAA